MDKFSPKITLTGSMIEGLAGLFLSPRYDRPAPTPAFHRECWERYASSVTQCATAAPRNHAKSTALTHDFVLGMVLLRAEQYVIVVSSSEELAIEHLGDIAAELRENEPLIEQFRIRKIVSDQKTDITVECEDGYQFRIVARGAEQKIRGRKWRGRRPGLIVCDDLEDDEQVANRDRRRKFRQWFFRACKQALRDGGKIRVHGTILHSDSLLAHLINNPTWASRCYRAHRSFSDFGDILWPEKFPEERLRGIRQEMIEEGDSAGYSQEYLNDPRDDEFAFVRKEDFIAMSDDDRDCFKLLYVGCDFAISAKDASNRTAFVVCGRDPGNLRHFVDARAGRWNALEIIDEMILIQSRWAPQSWFVEKGQIWSALWPVLRNEMLKRDVWLDIVEIASTQDKAARGKSFQKLMRAGACRFDTQGSWFDEFEDEILSFTPGGESVLDDQFDATTIVCRGLEDHAPVEDEDRISDEEREFDRLAMSLRGGLSGRNQVTGY